VGTTRLLVTTKGGPYTLSIESLVAARELPANSTTEVALSITNRGEYMMRLEGGQAATAILEVLQATGQ
jgi:hypothetical protein